MVSGHHHVHMEIFSSQLGKEPANMTKTVLGLASDMVKEGNDL